MLMKYLVVIIFMCGLLSCNTQKRNDIKDIETVLTQQAEEWNKGNIAGYMHGYWNSDSLLFIGKSGPTYGYKNTLERYEKAYPDKAAMGKLTFSALKFRKLTDSYYHVVGHWSLQRATDNPNGYFTLIFRRIDGQWRIIADHSS